MSDAAAAPVERPRRRSAARTIVMTLAVSGLDALLLALALGGLGALLAHRRALALLLVWLAGGLVLAFLRTDRSRAAVEVRRDSPLVLLLLFFIPLLTPAIAAYGERAGLAILPGGPALRWAGVAISGLGFGVRVAAMRRLGARFSPLVAMQAQHALETGGAYAFVRHPGYVGSLLATLGAVLAFGSAIGLPTVIVMALLLGARVRREEALLEQHFGAAWLDYRGRTGAFLPRFGGR